LELTWFLKSFFFLYRLLLRARKNVQNAFGLVNLHLARVIRWQPNVYDLILLDVRRHLPGEALEFYEQIKHSAPWQCFAFLIGPPVYLSRTWPGEVTADDASQGQWRATINRFLAAA